MARGGRRTPANPAPVSGPGALSRRTDGGAGQPIRVAPGGAYGARQASVALQQAAPLQAGPPRPTGQGTVAPAGLPMPNVFAPTNRPAEPPTAGATARRDRVLPQDSNALLRVIYNVYPHPEIARLIEYWDVP